MTNSVTTKPSTNIEALPNELLAPILRMTGQSTCARVSRHWHDVQMINFSSLRNEYNQNPKIRKFMPTTDRPETAFDCGEILRETVANVRDYYRKFSGVQPDDFPRTSLIEACDLEELINKADDKNLATLWNHLPPEIIQQLAALTPYPANATNAQIASAIRNGIQTNRAAILAVLSQVTELQVTDLSLEYKSLSALPREIGLFVNFNRELVESQFNLRQIHKMARRMKKLDANYRRQHPASNIRLDPLSSSSPSIPRKGNLCALAITALIIFSANVYSILEQ